MNLDMLFFDSWETLTRIVVSAIVVYFCIIVFIKVSGKRSTSQLNSFDWIVTVMMGSIGASTILLQSVPIVEGASSIMVLLLLQYLVTKYAAISPEFSFVVQAKPEIVFYEGQFLYDTMKQQRLTRQELVCAMRSEGIRNFEDVAAIIFESDAKLTVVPKPNRDNHSTNSDPSQFDTLDKLI